MSAPADPPCAHGGPPLTGILRAEPEDFVVEEDLGFDPAGTGEHAFLLIEKREANTDWVARHLAEFAGVAPMAIGYAGLKDRHALTRQTFSVHLPGRADPDWTTLALPGVRVLAANRHTRKLKRGSHRGNRFRIRLCAVRGEHAAAERCLAAIRVRGVPNYFGEQRFGRDAGNLVAARALFAGRRLPRHQRGLALSAARAHLFNAVLTGRVAEDNWDSGLDGEVWMLAGTRSVFGPVPGDTELARRAAAFDIHPTGPLWGRGELRSVGSVRALERAVAEAHPDLAAGLAGAGLDQERRALRLKVDELSHEWRTADSLMLAFRLPAGTYATSVLRELCDWCPARAI